ncbi:MAG: ribonuclease E [Dinoroseobacter sp.]|jgi:ribonuclease E
MAKKMLIDATHAEETRVVVVDGNKVEEFDFESLNKRQLAGNIYLAKVTRVEPSLQAAFVDYGGNRHGFLAFSEIHPDYYQIPVADREALIAEELAYAKSLDDEDEDKPAPKKPRRTRRKKVEPSEDVTSQEGDEIAVAEAPVSEGAPVAEEAPVAEVATAVEVAAVEEAPAVVDVDAPVAAADEATPKPQAMAIEGEDPVVSKDPGEGAQAVETGPALEVDAPADISGMDVVDLASDEDAAPLEDFTSQERDSEAAEAHEDDGIESVAEEDLEEEIRPQRKPRPRRYKIQEVIKVRQILLVQVVKEERGNKGAALTTYLSLAGRYCVLMPNTARGGGISRKITNPADRKKLKEIAQSIEVPDGAGLIVRTAGSERTKPEIKRDYEYLQRLWEQIRELTLKSIAPAQIYEEGNLIKRSIRDLYNREIDEVIVEGEEGYRTAKEFMKMLMPSHARNVKLHQEGLPLFAKFQVESYLAAMFNPTVQLRSGGYIVIDLTEALVAIDVNSGRATKEGSIEETALKTNIEAAEEVARQVRLRDLAGLIVIDFIDMDERKNNAAVEKRFKDRLKTDRARIQVGRISGFGLMEMSRQRLRPGMLEATTQPCPSCHGTGMIRSDDSIGLMILRQLEEEGTRRRSREVLLKAPVNVINFLMNTKREHIAQIEGRYGLSIRLEADPHLVAPDFTIEKFKTATRVVTEVARAVIFIDTESPEEVIEDEEDEIEEAVVIVDEAPVAVAATESEDETETEAEDDQPKRKRRRRRRRKPGGGENGDAPENGEGSEADADTDTDTPDAESSGADATEETAEAEGETSDEDRPKRKRRSRRGGRGRRRSGDAAETETPDGEAVAPAEIAADVAAVEVVADVAPVAVAVVAEPAAEVKTIAEPVLEVAPEPEVVVEPQVVEPEPEVVAEPEVVEVAPTPVPEPAAEAPSAPKRRGWWSRG